MMITNSNTTSPELSAVMLVYNGEKHIGEAIESVLQQNFKDFELIIINDGSTDNTLNIIQKFDDSRIRVINNPSNLGIPLSRNIGLQNAKGNFLAWCDSDDINFPNRFQEQINFLKNNESYGVCGSWQIYTRRNKDQVHRTEANADLVKAMLLFMPSIMNPTAMLRLSSIKKYNLCYDPALAIGEDHHFFLRCSMHFPLTNVQKALVKYRFSESSIIKKYRSQREQKNKIHNIIHAHALKFLGIDATAEDLTLHLLTCSSEKFKSFNEYKSCLKWLLYLQQKNKETKVFDKNALNKVLAYRFYIISKKASVYGLSTLHFYIKNSYKNFGYANINNIIKTAAFCILKNTAYAKRNLMQEN